MASKSGQGQQIDLSSLPVPQLESLKTQLDSELTHLTTSFTSLRTAQSKFRDCLSSIASLTPPPTTPVTTSSKTTPAPINALNKPLLVPLTSSLYVPGALTSPDKVLIDVGTGFFIEKGLVDARDFYERKVKDLGDSLKDLEGVINQKAQNVRVVEEVMRVKVLGAQEEANKGKA
ncbi:Prefoldin-domain-containing protein [Amniculicola lignicola CBS 123094]|uniref:Prefoldin-domain-containing protein n=1 Tax=Amniculicola lignicola CBS 123094 TaxID=1392246 RepID=A0A6A5WN46_9PLEO|nr:Prefoldin-domain-containing protein [Amniculicola lignicola CBS 123094]